MTDPLLVTVAGIGAEVDRAQQPSLPLLPDEVGEEYRRAYEAGATIGHIHGRRPDGAPTQDRETFRAFSNAIAARCPIIRQFSTGGAVGMSVEERIEALDLRPDMATLTLGTTNFGDDLRERDAATARSSPDSRFVAPDSRSSTTDAGDSGPPLREGSSSRRAFRLRPGRSGARDRETLAR